MNSSLYTKKFIDIIGQIQARPVRLTERMNWPQLEEGTQMGKERPINGIDNMVRPAACVDIVPADNNKLLHENEQIRAHPIGENIHRYFSVDYSNNQECPICQVKCNITVLIKHLEKHYMAWPYFCDECHSTFKSRSNLTNHLISHNKNKAFKCLECGSKFHRENLVRNHIVAKHKKKVKYKCPLCKIILTSYFEMQKHNVYYHEQHCEESDESEKHRHNILVSNWRSRDMSNSRPPLTSRNRIDVSSHHYVNNPEYDVHQSFSSINQDFLGLPSENTRDTLEEEVTLESSNTSLNAPNIDEMEDTLKVCTIGLKVSNKETEDILHVKFALQPTKEVPSDESPGECPEMDVTEDFIKTEFCKDEFENIGEFYFYEDSAQPKYDPISEKSPSGVNDLPNYSGVDDLTNYSGVDDLTNYSGVDDLTNYSGVDGLPNYSAEKKTSICFYCGDKFHHSMKYYMHMLKHDYEIWSLEADKERYANEDLERPCPTKIQLELLNELEKTSNL